MFIHAIAEITTQIVSAAPGGFGDVCAQAPSQEADGYARQLVGNIKWGVIWTIVGCGFLSAGTMAVGKIANSSRAAQIGSAGLFWTIVAAVAFACIYGILIAVVGNGC